MIELLKIRSTRYQGKVEYRVTAVAGKNRVGLGKVQQVATTGKWWHNPQDRARVGPHDDRDTAVAELIAEVQKDVQHAADYHNRRLATIIDGNDGTIDVNDRGW